MLIKRLAGAQPKPSDDNQSGGVGANSNGASSPTDPQAPVPAPFAPTARNKGAMPTEVMGGTGTSPLPRNTVLQGRYDVEQVLGIGGMSTVYRARDLRFTAVARYCAIKEMPDTAPDPRTG